MAQDISKFIQFQRVVKRLFSSRYILVTNTVTSGVLLGLGDWIVQQVERSKAFPQSDKNKTSNIDWSRTGRMFVVGTLFGPMCHGWYKFLDSVLPSNHTKTVMKKVFVDQAVASPVFITYFFYGTGLLQGHTMRENWRELSSKFWTVYLVDCLYWPAMQAVNFLFLPPHLRVVYIGFATLGYNAFLSYMKHQLCYLAILSEILPRWIRWHSHSLVLRVKFGVAFRLLIIQRSIKSQPFEAEDTGAEMMMDKECQCLNN